MKLIKKFLQNIFKKFFQLLFKMVYGTVIYSENNLSHENISINKIENDDIRKYDNGFYYTYSILNGRVYTDQVENVAIINGNKILDKISYQQQKGNLNKSYTNVVLKKGTPRIKKEIKGRVLSLAQGASGHANYSHWLFDILPKIKLYSKIYNIDDLNYIYLNKLKNFQKNSLDVLGLKNVKILDSNKFRHIQAEELVCIEHPSYYEGYILEQAKNLPSWIVMWLREVYLSHASKFSCNDKVFIDRTQSQSKHCQFQNEDEITSYLKQKGFTKYKLESLSFFQQIYLFNNAKIIIGAHGAGFTNLTFSNNGAKVIEIRPKNNPNTVYRRLSEINKLDYNLIETSPLSETLNQKGDIFINIESIEKII
tara:strand:- start:301 stop:1401 length:1101 start_codon:yes stop_codon:yes gene_type:complete